MTLGVSAAAAAHLSGQPLPGVSLVSAPGGLHPPRCPPRAASRRVQCVTPFERARTQGPAGAADTHAMVPVLASPAVRRARSAGPAERGVTLVELMVVIALVAVLLGLTAPPFVQMLAKMRLEGAGHNLATDLQFARTEAVQRRAAVSLATSPDGSSYGITSGAQTIKTVSLPAGVSFTGNVTITVEPLRGLANAAEVTGSSSRIDGQLRVATDLMGRVRMCSPGTGLKGYPAC